MPKIKQFVNFHVNVPKNGTPVPLLFQEKISLTAIQPEEAVYIGNNEGIGNGHGMLLRSGSTFGFGAADVGNVADALFNLYVCVASPDPTSTDSVKVTGIKVIEV